MIIHALIQARLGSKRFPRKIMAPLNGKPLLYWVIGAATRARMIDRTIVCVPKQDRAELSRLVGTFNQRAVVWASNVDENDVAGRFVDCLMYEGRQQPVIFVRICADSPLLHPAVIDLAAATLVESGDMHFQPDNLPHGQQAVAIRSRYLIDSYPDMDAAAREHCALPHRRAVYVAPGPRMTVDEPDDLVRVEEMMQTLGRPHWEYEWPEMERRLCG